LPVMTMCPTVLSLTSVGYVRMTYNHGITPELKRHRVPPSTSAVRAITYLHPDPGIKHPNI